MRSRTLLLTGLVHLLGILIMPYVADWEFLTTGLITGGSVLMLAELQWNFSATCGKG